MNIYHIFTLLGGLGLFLYGMKLMSDGLKLVVGHRLKRVLEQLTDNKWMGAAIGVVVTALIQSSTATTLIVLSFVDSAIISLYGAVAVNLGANVGTAISGILLTFNIQPVAPLIVFVGATIMLFIKNKKLYQNGMILLGFGLLFFGLGLMSDSMVPMRDAPFMKDLFESTRNPLIGILVGFLVTAIIQSSTASLGIILSMITVGIITDLNQALFVLYGMNLGRTVTAFIATIGATKPAIQAAVANLLINLLGVAMFTLLALFRFDLAALIQSMTSNVNNQLVYAHIIFNVVTTVVLLPFIDYIVKWSTWIVKNGKEAKSEFKFNFIDIRNTNPSIALSQTTNEIARMMDIVSDSFMICFTMLKTKSESSVNDVIKNEKIIHYLNREIGKFLVNLETIKLTSYELEAVTACYKTIGSLERMGALTKDLIWGIDLYVKGGSYPTKTDNKIISIAKKVKATIDIAFLVFKTEHHKEKQVDKIKALIEEIKALIKANGIVGINVVRISNDLARISNHALNIARTQRYKEKPLKSDASQ